MTELSKLEKYKLKARKDEAIKKKKKSFQMSKYFHVKLSFESSLPELELNRFLN